MGSQVELTENHDKKKKPTDMTKEEEEANAVSILNMLGQLVHKTAKYQTEISKIQKKKKSSDPTEFICTATFGKVEAKGTDTSKKKAKHIAAVNLLKLAEKEYGTLEEARKNQTMKKQSNGKRDNENNNNSPDKKKIKLADKLLELDAIDLELCAYNWC